MANFNKVMLLGNLTRDPQLRYTPNQTAVVELGLATNRKWRGQDGSNKEEVCFVDCVSFGKQAETINKYLNKGSQIFIEGRLTYDSWTAQDGSKRSRLRVTIESFQFIGSAGGGRGGQSQGQSYGSQQQAPQAGSPGAVNQNDDFAPPPMDDDIPF